MVRTPPKRTASRSPDNGRPYKRAATSSPEEGEVKDDDDATPHASLPPRPVSPTKPPDKFESKVKFPFKKKNGIEHSSTLPPPPPSLPPPPVPPPPPLGLKPELKEKPTAVIYERSEEDDRRIREKEQQWKQPSRRKAHGKSADHWEPSFKNRNKERSRLSGTSWHHDRDHRNRQIQPSDWEPYPDRGHGRSSHSLSRSPPSSTSTHKGKHRLPSHRECSPVYNFSPPRRDYGVDRIRDKQRERDDARDRDRGSRHPDDDDHDYGRSHDRQHPNREWERVKEREPDRGYDMKNEDRYWRPGASPQQDYYRRDDHDYSRASYDGDRRRGMDSYRPGSPGPSNRPTSSYPPRSPSPIRTADGPRTPPPPSDPPPPPPPEPKGDILPYEHATVSIPMPTRRPGAPLDIHSPTPLPLPPPEESVIKQERERKDAEDSRGDANGMVKERVVKKREPMRRSGKEEYEAYGRSFEGCGMQSDYDVTTKLGEGTFGSV